jgi:hypothetical protein
MHEPRAIRICLLVCVDFGLRVLLPCLHLEVAHSFARLCFLALFNRNRRRRVFSRGLQDTGAEASLGERSGAHCGRVVFTPQVFNSHEVSVHGEQPSMKAVGEHSGTRFFSGPVFPFPFSFLE